MRKRQQLKVLTAQLHISHSQIATYLACSLKYRYRYVERRPPERQSISLPFGIAIHSAVEHYYRSQKETGSHAPLEHLEELFSDSLSQWVGTADAPVVFNKTLPDIDKAQELGGRMLEALVAGQKGSTMKIIDVELPLSAALYDEDGRDTGFQLIGIIDLLAEDDKGRLTVADLKTAAKSKNQRDVDSDLQLSGYACLLEASRYIMPGAPVACRLDVLMKTKTPKLVRYHTERTSDDRNRFVKIASRVLHGIDSGVFMPNRGWMCTDCEYADACSKWHMP